METSVMFADCPAYLNESGSVRCGLPAGVEGRYTMRSTDGPLESVRIRCPRGHWFNGPVESLILPQRSQGPDAAGGRQRGGNPPAAAEPAEGRLACRIVLVTADPAVKGGGHLHPDPNPRSAGPRLRQSGA